MTSDPLAERPEVRGINKLNTPLSTEQSTSSQLLPPEQQENKPPKKRAAPRKKAVPLFKNLRKSVESNPYIFLIVVVMSTAAVVSGVLIYFFSEKTKLVEENHKLEIQKLESQLSSINRRIVNNEFLDIRTFIYPGYKRSQIPTTSKYFPADDFYASSDQSYWEYSKTNERELMKMIVGTDVFTSEAEQVLLPMHLWRGKDCFTVNEADGNINMFPYISIKPIPSDYNKRTRGMLDKSEREDDPTIDPKQQQDEFHAYERAYQGDLIGFILKQRLNLIYAQPMIYPNTITRLEVAQKVGNVLYIQYQYKTINAVINGRSNSEFYIRREEFFVSRPQGVILIETSVPSLEPAPRGEIYNQTTKWFGELAIPID